MASPVITTASTGLNCNELLKLSVTPFRHHDNASANLLLGFFIVVGWLAFASLSVKAAFAFDELTGSAFLSPTSLVASHDGTSLFIACTTANRVLHLDLRKRRIVATFKMPSPPTGLAISSNSRTLFVACSAPESRICVIDLLTGKIVDQIPGGHTSTAPVIAPNDQTLFVCNRFNNDISVIDLQAKTETRRIPVKREPVAAALTKDGEFLLVANLLPAGRADSETVSSVVSVVDWKAQKVIKDISLPDGGTELNDIKVSPDGNYAVATHLLARYHLPADQVERGWMNANAFTIIDVSRMEILNTILLDDTDSGAANPWGITWSADGRVLVVTHAGTHEVSVIDFPGLLAKLQGLPVTLNHPLADNYGTSARVQSDVPNDLTFLSGLRKRVRLPNEDRGPRAVAMIGAKVYVANYFSDTLTVVDISQDIPVTESIPLGPKHAMSLAHQGELYFNDASLCYQGWQSCSSCHPSDARVDGLNWDLPNDGIGNPKNTKSLLFSFQTPPCMSLGVRTNASAAVMAGIRNILFTKPHEDVAAAIDEYLKSLKPVPSPYLVHGNLSKAAKRGERLFVKAGCADCHLPGLYTDLHPHDVGTRDAYDGTADKFYTPTLIEVWRTAPYLHDGAATTILDVLTTCNHNGLHGNVPSLSHQEVEDLSAYVLSL
jgi:YVTN family beta-propeller protein